MKVAILDDWERYMIEHASITRLREHFEVTAYHDKPSEERLLERLAEADIVIPVRERTRFTKSLLSQLPHLKLIAQTGSGLAHIDMNEASRLKIPVTTTPGGSGAVAELIIGFMIAYSRRIIPLHKQVSAGEWPDAIGASLEGKTLGIIGLGKIGSRVAAAANAFGMNVLAWSPNLTVQRAREQHTDYAALEHLLQQSDMICLTIRFSERTNCLLKEQHFQIMKPTALLINTSRGQIVDEDALISALARKRIGGAALDVFVQEPLAPDHPLLSLDNVILTPHIGWKTDRMFSQFINTAVDRIIGYVIDGDTTGIVNLDQIR
ncbi:D-2-hydroxyacid dehydrogenase family protein [Paenibacillus tarimensis]|uniref:D-2-hydroxyacid dehydrogenase family protein n=1 Tax=Paenibacillus tarimensis TaxID=416012 RepID=UPI001F34CBC5|nr:D-2-hydroxyacid dehydrogenase family protein [Paenibacillus tarimensis]MCF2944716.1 D-2-hydroxyacid dehydrogenase family protein [Paenibacillus tarimensis]